MDDPRKTIEDILKPTQLMSLATLTEDGKPWVRYVMGQAQKRRIDTDCHLPQLQKSEANSTEL